MRDASLKGWTNLQTASVKGWANIQILVNQGAGGYGTKSLTSGGTSGGGQSRCWWLWNKVSDKWRNLWRRSIKVLVVMEQSL